MTDSVAKRSKASGAMVTSAARQRALMGGTQAMRAAGVTYLPRFGKESQESYTARLQSSWLFNGYRKTVQDMTGRVFAVPVECGDETDARLREWCEDIDLQGRDLSTFARQVFEDGLSGPGVSYILVDAPRRKGTVTQAQAQAQNLRPFCTALRVEDILGWKTALVNNVQTLTQLRVKECLPVDDPKDEFAEADVDQIRVLDLMEGRVRVRLYREQEKTPAASKWVLHDEYMTDAPEITLVPFYANRDGFLTGKPLLDDLADINIAHWQSQSDQRNILHFARVPILFAAGVSQDALGIIGGSTAVATEAPEAKLTWVEHGGKAIEAGRQDLKDLEFQMETFGLSLLVAKAQGQSATGEALDAAKETSTLAMTADALQDALEQSLIYMARYAGLPENVSVAVNKDFGVTLMGAAEMSTLLTAVRDGVLSQTTFIEEMARRGMIRPDISPDEEMARISDDEYIAALPGTTSAGGMPGQQ